MKHEQQFESFDFKRDPYNKRDHSQKVSVDEAQALVLSKLPQSVDSEFVDLGNALLGRRLADDVTSDIAIPPFDNSAMDGFALRLEDLRYKAAHNEPLVFKVVELIPAGEKPQKRLDEYECARIMTGGVIPDGADIVIKIEDSSAADGGGDLGSYVEFFKFDPEHTNIRRAGEEVEEGQVILECGSYLDASALGLLASAGAVKVPVSRRPLVAIIATGSELVDVSVRPQFGQIRNSNAYVLAALVEQAGGIARRYSFIEDSYEGISQLLLKAAQECDVVITTGGVSVGDYDYVAPAIEQLGELYFSKVLMRPGSHQIFGRIQDALVFGLPGNPSSAYTGFEVLVRPCLRKLMGYTQVYRLRLKAALETDYRKHKGTRYFQRGELYRDETGEFKVRICKKQSSALLGAMHAGNVFIVFPEDQEEFKAGDKLECLVYDLLKKIEA